MNRINIDYIRDMSSKDRDITVKMLIRLVCLNHYRYTSSVYHDCVKLCRFVTLVENSEELRALIVWWSNTKMISRLEFFRMLQRIKINKSENMTVDEWGILKNLIQMDKEDS